TASRCRSPTRSARLSPSVSTSRPSAQLASTRRRSWPPSARSSTCVRPPSFAISTCSGPSTRRRPPTATSAASCPSSRGRSSTASTRCEPLPGSDMPEHPAHVTSRGPRRIARVLVDSPLPQLDRLFDYVVPAELADEAVPGVRVKVPLRSAGRVIQGFVVGVGGETDDERTLSEIDTVVSTAEVLPERLYRLARAVADRAAGSANDILRLAIPRRMVRAEKAWLGRDSLPRLEVESDALERARELLAEYPGLDETLAGAGRVALDAAPGIAGSVPAWANLLAAAAVTTLARGQSAVVAVPDHRDLARLTSALAELAPEGAVVRLDAEL